QHTNIMHCLSQTIFFHAEDGIRDRNVTGVQTCALPILLEHREQVQRALAEHPKATAIIAYNDDVALRTLSALQSLGVTVPEEVSLIGVDNRPFSRDTHPPLTTVSYSYAMAELTPEVIETFVEGAGRSGLATDITAAVHVETLERESVGPPRASTRTALPGYPNAN